MVLSSGFWGLVGVSCTFLRCKSVENVMMTLQTSSETDFALEASGLKS